jgi:guanylate kinase
MFINHQPFLIIVSSPSGAGKSTICQMIIKNDPLIKLSVSATTRSKRPQETEGKDYFFINNDRFEQIKQSEGFLEYAEVFNNKYGTLKDAVFDNLRRGYETLFDIDWQGARQIKQHFQGEQERKVVSIFILPPSLQELHRRLTARGQDSEEVVNSRMAKAIDEISHFHEYDFVIVNDDLSNSYNKLRAIIETYRIKNQPRQELDKFVKSFLTS